MKRRWFNPDQMSQDCRWTMVKRYQALTPATLEQTWKKMMDLADMSWHPLLSRTNVPRGLVPKPGLIYEAINRILPLPFRIFVEGVKPRQRLSFRIMIWPGVEERVTYQIESSVCGTCISYSVMLRGWLAPLIWSVLRGYAAEVANRLAEAAVQDSIASFPHQWRSQSRNCWDLL